MALLVDALSHSCCVGGIGDCSLNQAQHWLSSSGWSLFGFKHCKHCWIYQNSEKMQRNRFKILHLGLLLRMFHQQFSRLSVLFDIYITDQWRGFFFCKANPNVYHNDLRVFLSLQCSILDSLILKCPIVFLGNRNCGCILLHCSGVLHWCITLSSISLHHTLHAQQLNFLFYFYKVYLLSSQWEFICQTFFTVYGKHLFLSCSKLLDFMHCCSLWDCA